jgi:acyl-CoA dehydrogenase
MCKLFCTEMVGRVVDRAVQVFGGMGYMKGNAVERLYRLARVLRIAGGSSEIQRMIIARAY